MCATFFPWPQVSCGTVTALRTPFARRAWRPRGTPGHSPATHRRILPQPEIRPLGMVEPGGCRRLPPIGLRVLRALRAKFRRLPAAGPPHRDPARGARITAAAPGTPRCSDETFSGISGKEDGQKPGRNLKKIKPQRRKLRVSRKKYFRHAPPTRPSSHLADPGHVRPIPPMRKEAKDKGT